MDMYCCRAVLGRLGCLIMLLMMAAIPAQASDSLYETEISVESQSVTEREAGFRQGLNIVLQRLTGQPDVLNLPAIAEARGQVSSLVSSFNYRELDDTALDLTQKKYLLQVRFNESSVKLLLRKNNLPLWGETRPSLLLWLAGEQSGRRVFIDSLSVSHVRDSMNRAAEDWGVPLVYPLLDFEDSQALDISDLWGLFADPISQASRRYGVNAVLAVRTWPAPSGRMNARALFMFRRQVMSFDFPGVQPDELSAQVIALAAQHMAAFYAVAPEGASGRPVRVLVDEVREVSDYAELLRYFEGLTAVRKVKPVEVKQDRILLDVVIDGSMEQLDAAISLGRRLAVSSSYSTPVGNQSDPVQVKEQSDLQYRWR